MRSSPVREKSFAFALRVIELSRDVARQREYVLSSQLLRSGTSIGANIEEARAGQSRKDFIAKMSIALKEANECKYWLRLVRDSAIISPSQAGPLILQADELIRLLTAIIKTTKSGA